MGRATDDEFGEFLELNQDIREILKNQKISYRKNYGKEEGYIFYTESFLAASAVEKEIADIIAKMCGVGLKSVICVPNLYRYEYLIENLDTTKVREGLSFLILAFSEYKGTINKLARIHLIMTPEMFLDDALPENSPPKQNFGQNFLTARIVSSEEFLCMILLNSNSFPFQ